MPQGKRLYAWTVDDPREMVRLIERGVGGLVTNAPDEAVRIRRERAGADRFRAQAADRAVSAGARRSEIAPATDVGAPVPTCREEGLGSAARLCYTVTDRLFPRSEEYSMNFDQLIRFAVDQGAFRRALADRRDAPLADQRADPDRRVAAGRRRRPAPVHSVDQERADRRSTRSRRSSRDSTSRMPSPVCRGFAATSTATWRTPAMVMRMIQLKIRTLDELQLPPVLHDITLSLRGMTLLTGTTGSGKSTTLAAMVDLINNSFRCKIITIEDPVEYTHANQKAMISQLELGQDTPSFEHGLRQALRQDPDVILVGELRDSETMRMALRAADTGHQVFATVHSTNAAQTIERILAMVPPEERSIATSQLAQSLQAVISQRLAVTRDGNGRCAAMEILRGGPVTAKYIMENRLGELSDYIAHPRERHAALRPALARPLPPKGHLRHRGIAAGDQFRGRRNGHGGIH